MLENYLQLGESQHLVETFGEVSMNDIDKTLNERGARYGDFKTHAEITQSIKHVMRTTEKWSQLSDDKKEALEMVAHKIGRILNGDPNYADSWHDIGGYTRLVEQNIIDNAPETSGSVTVSFEAVEESSQWKLIKLGHNGSCMAVGTCDEVHALYLLDTAYDLNTAKFHSFLTRAQFEEF